MRAFSDAIGFTVMTSLCSEREIVRPVRSDVNANAKKFAQRGKIGLKIAVYGVLGELFRARAQMGLVLGEFFRARALMGLVLGELFRARALMGLVLGEFFRARAQMGLVLGEFFCVRAEMGLVLGEFFRATGLICLMPVYCSA